LSVSEETASGRYFLSYSRSDEETALRLAKDLRAGGVAMWVDQLDIRPSEHWDRAIERAVQDCRGLVVVLSPRSIASNNVADEISFAIDSGKSVLPVMIERCALPLRLTRMQTIDATRDYDRALQQCLEEIARRDGGEAAARPVEEARVPLDPGEISLAKERLAPILGPISGKMVDQAAAKAGSIEDCYQALSRHIEDPTEREQFLKLGCPDGDDAPKLAAAPRKGAQNAYIPAVELESIAKSLTNYLGPIAPVIVKREAQKAASVQELREQLAAMITDEVERADFLR
jgi:hypothetical protein